MSEWYEGCTCPLLQSYSCG